MTIVVLAITPQMVTHQSYKDTCLPKARNVNQEMHGSNPNPLITNLFLSDCRMDWSVYVRVCLEPSQRPTRFATNQLETSTGYHRIGLICFAKFEA